MLGKPTILFAGLHLYYCMRVYKYTLLHTYFDFATKYATAAKSAESMFAAAGNNEAER